MTVQLEYINHFVVNVVILAYTYYAGIILS